MKVLRRFTVRPALPAALSALQELASNLRWSWHEPTSELFREISDVLWTRSGHDPLALLSSVGTDRLEALAADPAYVARADALLQDLRRYLDEPRWYQSLAEAPEAIAYFSPEFGITAALPQYSGGLGILAGDHLKSASDLGVPLLGIGLYYRSGYFRQSLSAAGWQQESYPVFDPDGLALSLLRNPDGTPATVSLALPEGRTLTARIRMAQVGRVRLLLLDADVPENDDGLRSVTDRLYGGDGEHRLRQELLLGIGGVRALRVAQRLLGTASPTVFHTNEGHAGFQGLERVAELIRGGLTLRQALEAVRASTVFTTHTPVAAGIDRFEASLVRRYFEPHDLVPGVDVDDVMRLGAEDYEGGTPGVFNMAVMGLRLAQRANGVSKLHGAVSRPMFAGLWPGFDADEVPIGSVTNGVHAATWTDPLLQQLAQEALGTGDTAHADWLSPELTDEQLWWVRGRLRANLVQDARARVKANVLDPDVLTIGFARRVATYKRLTLMLHDRERLIRMLNDPEHPVQLVVAGKAHPADDEGKRLIQELIDFTEHPEVRGRLVFLPDYDIGMAQTLYPGCDIWLNNPLRPLEACGTSGMKAALNGTLNLSILDGWWAEFYDGENGWAIPSADTVGDGAERDAREANALYDLIENEIAPRFYDRDEAGIPSEWMRRVRHSMAALSPQLSADRMVTQYVDDLYVPAHRAAMRMSADDFAAARDFAGWKARVHGAWNGVSVAHVGASMPDDLPSVGDGLRVRAHVLLGELGPGDVAVEAIVGRVCDDGALRNARYVALEPRDGDPAPSIRFEGVVPLTAAGTFGYTVRVVPRNPAMADPAELGLVVGPE
ncbi:alpha-glucan family phosphorylase [Humibacter albus]|uniref:alpha-glucan family phosphorylase n=1 Tax=Humibacter albus TaxID=427754 RepID=UPI0003B607DF|nr:alpha-glucan family phosphorylase [Humibacter albus]